MTIFLLKIVVNGNERLLFSHDYKTANKELLKECRKLKELGWLKVRDYKDEKQLFRSMHLAKALEDKMWHYSYLNISEQPVL